MSAIQQLLTDHLDIWTAADTEKKSGRGRSSGNAASVYGVKKLRELILELAVRGKLVPQDVEWKKLKLIDLGYWAIGSGFPTCEQGRDNDEILFAKVSDMNIAGNEKFIVAANNTITNETAKRLKINVHSAGSVIFPKIGGAIATNKRRILTRDTAIDNNCLGLTPKAGVSTDWLYLLLCSIDLTKYQAGTSVPALAQKVLQEIPVMLPDLSEQHRIVAKVDELMALCDQLENQHNNAAVAHEKLVTHLLGTLTQSQNAEDFNTHWQRISEHFDTLFTTEASIDALKQTLLQLAVMGKLVPQDTNDEPASELLKRIQAEKAKLIAEGKIKKDKPLAEITEEEKPFELPVGWEWVRLGNALLKITDGTHHSPINLSTGSFKYISAKNIKSWGIDLDNVTYVTEDVHEGIYSRCNPEYGDVLYIKDGATTGIATINTLKEPFSMLSSVALLKPSVDIYNEYLLRAITAPFFYAEIRAEMTGVAITRVTLSKINNALIPISSLTSQKRILIKLKELMTICDQLKSKITSVNQLQQKLADVMTQVADC